MAGLISEKMAPQGAPETDVDDAMENMGAGGEQVQMEQEAEADESHPAFQAAMELAMEALYGQQAAKGVAESLRIAQDPVDGLANTAYEIVSIIDERTNGDVPDELLVLLATNVLEEVGEIAEAAGIEVTPATVATALKQMILRFLGEQGVDTTQLEQAMGQVNPEEFNQMAMDAEGEQTEEEVPV